MVNAPFGEPSIFSAPKLSSRLLAVGAHVALVEDEQLREALAVGLVQVGDRAV